MGRNTCANGNSHDVSDTHNFNLQRVPTEFAIEKRFFDCLQALTIPDTLEEAINNVLEIIGNFYQATRAYIVEIDLNTKIGSNTYEWCRETILTIVTNYDGIDLNEILIFMKLLNIIII